MTKPFEPRTPEEHQPPAPAQIIAKRTDRVAARKLWLEFIWKAAVILLAFWLILTFVCGIKIVTDDSMSPSLFDGDLTFYYRLDTGYLSEDVVAYTDDNGQTAYSRIIAVPGDTVDFDENGVLLVNGSVKAMDGEKIVADNTGNRAYPYTVPEDSYFLLNDNTGNTNDSRTIGAVDSSRIEGRIIQLLRRRNF